MLDPYEEGSKAADRDFWLFCLPVAVVLGGIGLIVRMALL